MEIRQGKIDNGNKARENRQGKIDNGNKARENRQWKKTMEKRQRTSNIVLQYFLGIEK